MEAEDSWIENNEASESIKSNKKSGFQFHKVVQGREVPSHMSGNYENDLKVQAAPTSISKPGTVSTIEQM